MGDTMPQNIIDMTGWIMKDHGVERSKLTVIKRNLTYVKEHNLKKNRVYWDCICECGNYCTSEGRRIRNGETLSCGCLHKNPWNKRDLTGQIFGWLTVLGDSGERVPNKYEILWNCKCKCGTIKKIRTTSLTSGKTLSCGCMNSQGEYYIAKILSENNISFEKNKTFNLCRGKSGFCLPFDFYINNNFLLEFDGKQHYYDDKYIRQSLEEIQYNDNLKNNFAIQNNIPIKRIPYWKLNSLNLEDIMSDKWLLKN